MHKCLDTFGEKQPREPRNSEQRFGRKRKFGKEENSNFSFKRGKVSKFTKVKEKAKLMKKQKQLGMKMKSQSRDPSRMGNNRQNSQRKTGTFRQKSNPGRKKVVAKKGKRF